MRLYEKPEMALTVFTPAESLLAGSGKTPETPIIPIRPKSGTYSGGTSPF